MNARSKSGKSLCLCPYCDETLEGKGSAYCQACRVTIFYCPECRKPMKKGEETCPACGAKIKS